MKQLELEELQHIPGVGKKIAEGLWNLGFRSIQDLNSKNPEKLYVNMCAQKSKQVDRCMLYVFRCAIYYASNTEHDPQLLKWENWKDKE